MRDLQTLDRYRLAEAEKRIYGCNGGSGNGMFLIPSAADGADLRVLASDGGGWDHVSVSRSNRCPSWEDMEQIARLFFADTEAVMQLHVPLVEHINVHPYCLHLWRPNRGQTIPRPPSYLVG